MNYYGTQPRGSSMTAWVVSGILIVVGVIGLVVFVAVVSQSGHDNASKSSTSATPTSSTISCPRGFVPPSVNADCYFLNMLASHGIASPDGQQGLIREGHALCAAMDQAAAAGQTPSVATLPMIRREHPELSIADAAFFGGISQAAYCSWNARQ